VLSELCDPLDPYCCLMQQQFSLVLCGGSKLIVQNRRVSCVLHSWFLDGIAANSLIRWIFFFVSDVLVQNWLLLYLV
jgi:hypothetical protein